MLTRDEIDEVMRRLAEERAELSEKLVEKRREHRVTNLELAVWSLTAIAVFQILARIFT